MTADNPQRELDSLAGGSFVQLQLEHFFETRGDEGELKKFVHDRLSPEIEELAAEENKARQEIARLDQVIEDGAQADEARVALLRQQFRRVQAQLDQAGIPPELGIRLAEPSAADAESLVSQAKSALSAIQVQVLQRTQKHESQLSLALRDRKAQADQKQRKLELAQQLFRLQLQLIAEARLVKELPISELASAKQKIETLRSQKETL